MKGKVKIADAVLPVFSERKGMPWAVGSVFLILVGEECILVTAAHVLDELESGNLYVPAGRDLSTIEGRMFKTTAPDDDRSKDSIDLGIVILTPKVAHDLVENGRWFIPVELLLPNAPSLGQYQYGFCGFPHSGSKLNRRLRKLRSSGETYTGACQSETLYARLERSPAIHIAIDFSHKKVANAAGTVVTPKDRDGTSGGPVFAYVNQPADSRIPKLRIVGVGIEHYPEHRTLVATKSDALITLIRKALPEAMIRPAVAAVVPARLRTNAANQNNLKSTAESK